MAAEAKVEAQVQRLRKAFLATGTAAGCKIATQGLDRFAPRLGGELALMLVAFDNASGEDRLQAKNRLIDRLAALKKFLDSDPAFTVLERNPFGVMVTIRSDIELALLEIESALSH